MGGSWVEQFAPDLVGDDEEIVALGNVGDRGDFFCVEDAARRVVGVAEQDDLRRAGSGELEGLVLPS